MTKESILTKLATNGGLDIKEEKPYKSNSDTDNIFPISYREAIDGEVESDLKHFELIKRGEEYKYHREIPPILRDTPTVTAPRDFILPESTVISKIEAHYTAENSGSWNGEVFEDSIDMRRKNSRDEIFVDIVNHQKKVEKRKEFIVSQTNAPDWVQPTGAHDAYDELGELVTHNGKVWENTHGTGNAWEPGGTDIADTIWKKVDAVKIRPVQ